METCSDWSSNIFGYLSIYCWLVAQVPQQVENYRNKRCDGISSLFLVLWFFGDLTSLIGCVLTGQLAFQIYLAVYFLYNDAVLFAQWYYYTYVYPNQPHHHRHHHRHHGAAQEIAIIDGVVLDEPQQHAATGRRGSLLKKGVVIASTMFSPVQGAPLARPTGTIDTQTIGVAVSWVCAVLYLGARVPQLYKNFKRKSVQGVSPWLFFTAIFANLCYTASIVFNCKFDMAFFYNELPYILGSSGTVVFDLTYFYQRWAYRDADKATHEMTRLI